MTGNLEAPGWDVDVIIPARNAAQTIFRTLRSLVPDKKVLAKIIVVDDGSTDNTVEVAQTAARELNLPLQVVQANCGSAGAARNAGMDHASGTYLHFLDSDDELVPGALTVLRHLLVCQPQAGIATGMTIRRSRWRKDLLKFAHGYSDGMEENTAKYLRNRLTPIAMGAAMVRRIATNMVRFPALAALDEDTVFWARCLWETKVATTDAPVLVYHLDLARMEQRFTRDPEAEFQRASEAIGNLAACGIPVRWLEWRIAWLSLRFARQLIMAGRPNDAVRFVRRARQSPQFARSWKVFQYSARILAAPLLIRTPPSSKARAIHRPLHRFMIITHDPVWPPVADMITATGQSSAHLPDMEMFFLSVSSRSMPIGCTIPIFDWPHCLVRPGLLGLKRQGGQNGSLILPAHGGQMLRSWPEFHLPI